jgi:hypothetical protein
VEMNPEIYGRIMETLGGIQSGIDALDEKLETANKNTCDRLDKIEKRTDARFEKVEDRVTVLEHKPGKWWDKLLGTGLGAAVGWVLGKIIK